MKEYTNIQDESPQKGVKPHERALVKRNKTSRILQTSLETWAQTSLETLSHPQKILLFLLPHNSHKLPYTQACTGIVSINHPLSGIK